MILSRYTAKNMATALVPDPALFALPEKVLQFGSSELLPGYFIDKTNKRGLFNGRIVGVGSTLGNLSVFEKQDGLFTQCICDLVNGKIIEENIINASISRVLQASKEWGKNKFRRAAWLQRRSADHHR